MENSKIEELTEKTILLLEKTKKEKKKYEKERQQLYYYLVNKNELIEWEKYVNKLNEVVII